MARARPTGSLVADRSGTVTSYACSSLQERGSLFIAVVMVSFLSCLLSLQAAASRLLFAFEAVVIGGKLVL